MVNKNVFVEFVVKKAMAQKKVSRPEKEVKDLVRKIADAIEFFNSLPEEDYSSLLKSPDEIKIPAEFKEFIIPESVRFDQSTYACPDLLVRSKVKEYEWSPFTWNIVCDEWRSLFKKDCNSDMVPLSEAKKKVVLHDIIDVISTKQHSCRSKDTPYIPVELSVDLTELIGSRYFNCSDADMIEDFMTSLKFN